MASDSLHTRERALSETERTSFAWLKNPAINAICAPLERDRPGCIRFVGGCVRDSLLRADKQSSGAHDVQPETDIDLAAQLLPQHVSDLLIAAGIKVIPTGIDHGTVTAVHQGQIVEITTLRKDVETDGRRATIAYTDDWHEDARRRDFTINALYLTPEGVLYDPIGGIDDLSARVVRFIGDANTRIKEDYLRILRFFRFTARFSPAFDRAGLDAVRANIAGIPSLSAERINSELMKILNLPRTVFALRAMKDAGVLSTIWQHSADLDTVEALRRAHRDAGALVTLAALYNGHSAQLITDLANRLRFSKHDATHLSAIIKALPKVAAIQSERDARQCLYQIGPSIWGDVLSLYGATTPQAQNRLAPLMDLPTRWDIPKFPLKGGDLIKRGIPAGPEISSTMAALEQEWIRKDFPGDDAFEALLADFLDTKPAK